jgi:predicted MFS family arabinose efflux permease
VTTNVDEAGIPAADRSAVEVKKPAYSKGYANYVLFVLLVMNTFAFMDRAIFNTLSQAIKKDLLLSDSQIGFLGGFGFVLVYTFCALPVARLSERVNRISLISVCLAFWSLATAASGLAYGYIQMLLTRVAVGAGEAGATPTAHSVIGDYFPADKRATAISIFVLGLPGGVLFGAFIGGWVAEHWGWRIAFMAVGLPGLLVALLLKMTVKEPVRGGADGKAKQSQANPSLLAVLKHLIERPTARHITVGFTLASFSTAGLYVFLPAILIRQYGFSISEAGMIYGSLAGVCTAIGMLGGGLLSDRLGKRDRRWFAWIPVISLAVTPPFAIIALLQSEAIPMLILLLVPFVVKQAYLPATLASYHNMTEPRMRATTIVIAFMFSNIIGSGAGPLVAGMISDAFAKGTFWGSHAAMCTQGAQDIAMCATPEAYGITLGVIVVAATGLWGALHFWWASKTIRQDFVA